MNTESSNLIIGILIVWQVHIEEKDSISTSMVWNGITNRIKQMLDINNSIFRSNLGYTLTRLSTRGLQNNYDKKPSIKL